MREETWRMFLPKCVLRIS